MQCIICQQPFMSAPCLLAEPYWELSQNLLTTCSDVNVKDCDRSAQDVCWVQALISSNSEDDMQRSRLPNRSVDFENSERAFPTRVPSVSEPVW